MIADSAKSLNKKFWLLTVGMLLSINIAFFAYSHWNWSEGVWSVVTIAAVANVDLSYTITKMWARLAGTLIGAVYAFLALYYFGDHIVLLCAMLSLGVFVFSLFTFQKSALNYAGLIANVTMFIVLGTAIHGNYATSAIDRVSQVIFGIVLLAFINSGLSYLFVKDKQVHRLFSSKFLSFFKDFRIFVINKSLVWTSFKVVVAMLITILPWLIFKYPGGFWASVSCFCILEESVARTKQKSLYRFVSHLCAALFGLITVLLLKNHENLLFIPLSLGFIGCSYILALNRSYSSSGNTMGIAIAIMLLADPSSPQEVIIARFINVMLGITVGLFVTGVISKKHS